MFRVLAVLVGDGIRDPEIEEDCARHNLAPDTAVHGLCMAIALTILALDMECIIAAAYGHR